MADNVNWVDITNTWSKNVNRIREEYLATHTPLTAVDLFCGAGGISLGFENANIDVVCGLDWFDAAEKTYKRNFNHAYVHGDIATDETKKRLYETVRTELNGRQLNIIAGGFPCQGFSLSGSRVVDDPRNSLYKEMLDVVIELQPDFVVCENVVGLRTMLDGAVERKIIEDYTNAGYDMNVTVLCAADYGVAQKRYRVIFVGNRIGLKNLHPKPVFAEKDYWTTKQVIEDLMTMPENKAFNHIMSKHSLDMQRRLLAVEEGKCLYGNYSDSWKKCPWNAPSCTIKENHGGVNIHPILPRVITPREMARLQGFTDDFIFEGAKAQILVQIGNAVPPPLAQAVGLAIIKSYDQK